MKKRNAALGLLALVLSTAVRAEASTGQIAFKDRVDIAEGRGERGPWQQNESRYDYVDDPAVAIDDRGEMSIVWVDQGRKDIFFQRVSPAGTRRFRRPVNISRSPTTFSWLPRVVVTPGMQEKILVLWQEIIFSPGGSHGGEIFFARSKDGGKTFSHPMNLSNSVGGDGKGRINRETWHNGSIDIVAGADGTICTAWTEYAGMLWFSRSTDGGKTFSRPRHIAGNDKIPTRGPSLAFGPDNTVSLAWTMGEEKADIHIATSSDSGISFGNPRVVAPSVAYSDAPKLAADQKGVLHMAYAESSGGPFERFHIRYTRSTDGGRAFERPREISGSSGPHASAGFPAVGIDGKGRLYVIWELFPNYRERPRGLGIVVSPDGGRSFADPRMVPGSLEEGFNGSYQGFLMKKLAVNRYGSLAIVNSSIKQDKKSRVWLIPGKLVGDPPPEKLR